MRQPARLAGVVGLSLAALVLPAGASAAQTYTAYEIPVYECVAIPSVPAGTEVQLVEYIDKGGGDRHLSAIPVGPTSAPEVAGYSFTETIAGQLFAQITLTTPLGAIPLIDLNTKHGDTVPIVSGPTPVVNAYPVFASSVVASSTCA